MMLFIQSSQRLVMARILISPTLDQGRAVFFRIHTNRCNGDANKPRKSVNLSAVTVLEQDLSLDNRTSSSYLATY